jgi:N-acetylneuraminic acid mutarotase/uncharacterized GH25 family protein
MICMKYRWLQAILRVAALVAMSNACDAHFLWIKTVQIDSKPQALLFFGESPKDESYHFPDKLAKTKLWSRAADGKQAEIENTKVDTDDRVGYLGPLKGEKSLILQATQQYGIYGTAPLVYHPKHIRGRTAEEINAAGGSKDEQLEIVPHVDGSDVKLTILWEGKPFPDADVSLLQGDKDPDEQKADKEGHVEFKSAGGASVGVLANTMEKDRSGELDGKPYKGVMHYATLTFNMPGHSEAAEKEKQREKSSPAPSLGASALPKLPEPLASFGGVVSNGWLYVYGGHTGEEHEHSAGNLSNHFRRIQLEGGTEWQELPMQTPLQGLPLVAHDGKIYRVGGLDILNPTTKDKEDLHSTPEFAVFDPTTNKWTELAPLPAARSSHNATLINDKLYVIGGWRLEGKSPGEWEPDALVYDFAQPADGWRKLPLPGFKRRAFGIGIWHGKVVVLGGMDEKAKVSMDVFVFDPSTGKWENGTKLPGAGMAGFGVSAWNLDGNLYESGLRGTLYRLSDTGSEWAEVGKLQTPRFFHQIVPGPHEELLIVGGASIDGQLATIERFDVKAAHVAGN